MDREYGNLIVSKLEGLLKNSAEDRRVSGVIQQVAGYIAELEGELEDAVHDIQKLTEAASKEASQVEEKASEVAALQQRIRELEEATRKASPQPPTPSHLLSKIQSLQAELLERGHHSSDCPWIHGKDCYCGWEEIRRELTGIKLVS